MRGTRAQQILQLSLEQLDRSEHRCVLTDRESRAMEHKGRDKDHDDHSEEYDRRDNTDGLEHLMMEGRERGRKDGEQLNVIATHKLTY